MIGLAGSWPSHSVPVRSVGNCGVEAKLVRVVEVITGVKWMKGAISL